MEELIEQLTMAPLAAGVLGVVTAAFFYYRVKGLPEGGTDTMNMIARYIREGAMTLFAFQQAPREGLEAQVGRVGMGDRQQILGVQESLVAKTRRDEALEEVYLEVGVVGDQHAPRQHA